MANQDHRNVPDVGKYPGSVPPLVAGASELELDEAAFWEHEEHPEPSTLVAYQEGRLSAEEADALQDHLVECRHCASLILDLVELKNGPRELDDETENEDERFDSPTVVPLQPRRERLSPWVSLSWAALLLISLGLGWKLLEAQRQLKQPLLLGPGASYDFDGGTRGVKKEPELRQVRLPATLSFTLDEELAGKEVELELRDKEQNKVWSVRIYADSPSPDVRFVLPRTFKPGLYRLEIRGLGSQSNIKVPFRLQIEI